MRRGAANGRGNYHLQIARTGSGGCSRGSSGPATGERTRQRGCDMKFVLLAAAFSGAVFAQTYDIVLTGGRAMDPESGLDGIRNVGITGRRIAAISQSPLQG